MVIAWVAAAALSFGSIEEGCTQSGDIFSCEEERTFATTERVQTPEGCVEKQWEVTQKTTSKRMWGHDLPFVEDVKTTQKLKASRVVSKSCSAARAAGK